MADQSELSFEKVRLMLGDAVYCTAKGREVILSPGWTKRIVALCRAYLAARDPPSTTPPSQAGYYWERGYRDDDEWHVRGLLKDDRGLWVDVGEPELVPLSEFTGSLWGSRLTPPDEREPPQMS